MDAYEPSPEVIEKETKRIREGWPEREKKKRYGYPEIVDWKIPVIDSSCLGLGEVGVDN